MIVRENVKKKERNYIQVNCAQSNIMDFFNTAITQLSTVVSALGAGLGAWGVINLLEGYGNDNRATRF